MKKYLYLFFLLLCTWSCSSTEEKSAIRLWYTEPASSEIRLNPRGRIDNSAWYSALPLGNGSLGAMVYGDVKSDRIQFNEKTLWSGCNFDTDNPEAPKHLGKIRKLLFAGKYKEATEIIEKTQICKDHGNPDPHHNGSHDPRYGSYQTMGDLWFDFDNKSEYTDYMRELDLETATARVAYTQEGVHFERNFFISQPDQVMVMKYTADQPGKLSFTCKMNRLQRFRTYTEKKQLIMTGASTAGDKDGMKYMARLRAIPKNGKVSYTDSTVRVENADEVILLLTAATDYRQEYPTYTGRDYSNLSYRRMEAATSKTWMAIYDAHLKEYSPYFNRVKLDVCSGPDTIPTDRIITNARKGNIDKHMYELVFQYGRYLLISSSRPGDLPANLQGMWAMGMRGPWNCDYHTDVNIQMSYWLAEATNLSECHLPYFDLLRSLVKPGEQTAKIQYNMKGWVVHPITNVWGYTSPGESASWGMHTGAPAWLCQHIMEHYRFTEDKAFLKELYPTMKGAVEFYLDWLTTDPETGKLVSGPAVSPENSFLTEDGSKSQFCMGPTHDQQVIRQLFEDFLEASGILRIKDNTVQETSDALKKLLDTQIAKDGRIMEWAHEFKEAEPGHRHLSHLFAVYPSALINSIQTPELIEAAEKSLDFRIAHGNGAPWSYVWHTSLYARMQKAEKATDRLDNFMKTSFCPNLFSSKPPFQMDANFGATAAMAEMLLQSHVFQNGNYNIMLLPALPTSWTNGSYSGLKARGGFEVSVKWKDGRIIMADVKSLLGNPCRIRFNGTSVTPEIKKNGHWHWEAE